MSLLTIVQDTLNEIGSTEIPASVVGSANQTAAQSLALVNRSLKEVAKRTNWQPLSRTETITTISAQAEYSLPSDFKSLVNQTMWDTTQRRRTIGALTPKDWAFFQSFSTTDTIQLFFRIFRDPAGNGQKVQFYPTPGSAVTITYEYISNALTQSSVGTLQSDKFLADDDTALLDEDTIALGFKWRFLKTKGFPYSEEFRDYEAAIAYEASSTGNQVIDMGSGDLNNQRVLVIPDGGFGS